MLCGTDIGVMLQGKPLLQAAHLTAHPREISVIIGPNGSGKTTLLRALTGEIAHSGQVLLNGADIRQQKKLGTCSRARSFTAINSVGVSLYGFGSGAP